MKPAKQLFLYFSLALFSQTLITSCGSVDDGPPPLVGTARASEGPAAAAYQSALAADQAGNAKKAAKLYGKMANNYPTAKDAPQARFREAQLHEQLGRPVEAFEAYSNFLTRYQGSKLYSQALARQTAISGNAASGEIKSGVFRSSLDTSELVAMQEKVRDAAPQAPSAPQAQFQIGEIYQNAGKARESIAAYGKVAQDWPQSAQAPEAQYRVGMILVEEAKRGNQDKGNLDRARDAFQDYLSLYPNGKRAAAARAQIATLGSQDVERSYEIAEFYRRKGDHESARFYYREVLKKQGSGPLHDKAQAGLRNLQ
jgi:outer membrane protein assembly factor BamD (BamD/ComL family)